MNLLIDQSTTEIIFVINCYDAEEDTAILEVKTTQNIFRHTIEALRNNLLSLLFPKLEVHWVYEDPINSFCGHLSRNY